MGENCFQKIYARVYSDYFSKDRFEEYDHILSCFCANQYKLMSVIGYYDAMLSNKLTNKVVILRHDIDTDPERAKCFLDIERKYGFVGSYYFRLTTLNLSLMQEIESCGGEASYHYEEIAEFAKSHHIHSCEEIVANLDVIRNKFIDNYALLKSKTNLPMRSVASHGDFVNRKLGLSNTIIVNDSVRRICGIEVETYDPILKNNNCYIADRSMPVGWYPNSPLGAICCDKNVYLLTHPRQWGANVICNLKADLLRAKEGIFYKMI